MNSDGLCSGGEVSNLGDKVSTLTSVVGTFYDVNGRVIFVASASGGDLERIASGAKRGFELTVLGEERTRKVANYKVVADSLEYTSLHEIPIIQSTSIRARSGPTFFEELALPVLIAGIALALGVFALRMKRQKRA